MRYLKQSTSVDIPVGPFLDETDGKTAETALTITRPDIRLKKNNAAWAQKAAAQTLAHEEAGWYEVTLDASDTDTIGLLTVAIHEAGALPVWEHFHILAANVYDSLFGAATDKLDVNIEEWNTTAVPAEHTAGYPVVTVKDGTGTGEINTNAGAVALVDLVTTATNVTTINGLAANVITAASIAAGAIDAATFAAGAIDAASIATDAFGALELAAGAATEIADAVWATAARTITGGTIGTYTGNTPQTGDVFPLASTEIADIKAKTDNLPSDPADQSLIIAATDAILARLPAALTGAGNIKADALAINSLTAAAANLGAVYAAFETGAAQAGAASTITIQSGASAVDDIFKDQAVFLLSGTGAGQTNRISGYVGSSKVATVSTAWVTQPDATTVYLIVGRIG